ARPRGNHRRPPADARREGAPRLEPAGRAPRGARPRGEDRRHGGELLLEGPEPLVRPQTLPAADRPALTPLDGHRCYSVSMSSVPAAVLAEAERSLHSQGRVVLCQIVRAEGSTPGKVGWKLLARPDGTFFGNLGGGALAEVFLEVLTAAPVLVVCGGGPVGQALARGATLAGFELLVADDREE